MPIENATIDEIRDYVRGDPDSRPLKFFDESLLELVSRFSSGQIDRLEQLSGSPVKLSLQHLHKFMIDLSWASSRLEGNTYDYLDTKLLLEEGIRSSMHSLAEAKMIINHKHAITAMSEGDPLTREMVCRIHSLLADDAGVEGEDHFLPPDRCGLVRTYEPLWISGTAYSPVVDQPGKPPVVSPALDKIVQVANLLHPFDASVYLLTRLPYLQPFNDCNKRTSRVITNAPLLARGYLPISLKNIERRDYLSGVVAFYELGDSRLMQHEFLRAFIDSLMINRSVPLDVSIAYSKDKTSITQELISYVNDGTESEILDRVFAPKGRSIGTSSEGPEL